MNVRIVSSLEGDRVSLRPGQIVGCPERVAARLIEHGIAEPAPAGSKPEQEFNDETPKEERPPMKEKAKAETASKSSGAERAVASGAPPAACSGQTKQGNPCARAPLPGTDRCAAHQREE